MSLTVSGVRLSLDSVADWLISDDAAEAVGDAVTASPTLACGGSIPSSATPAEINTTPITPPVEPPVAVIPARTPAPEPAALPATREEIENILTQSWEHYKQFMIAPDGRPLADTDGGDLDGDGDTAERVTVSEAVSYVLLRAVWMNDRDAFDLTWNWARQNMQRMNLGQVYFWNQSSWVAPPQSDRLFSWRYVPTLKERDGGVIHYTWVAGELWRGCFEGATDADMDIAASLVFASRLWGDPSYLSEASSLISDMWDKYVAERNGKYYLFGGDQFQSMGEVNPSYMRPTYYDMFAEVDPSHPWQELHETSYRVVIESGDIPLHGIASTTNLPSNWIGVNYVGSFYGSDTFRQQGGHLFGWDAFRTLFWIAEDYAWFSAPEAYRYLTDNTCTPEDYGPYCFLNSELTARGEIMGGYNRDGGLVSSSGEWWSNKLNREQFTMNGAYLAYFYYAGNQEAANTLYANLQSDYHEEGYWGDNPNDYFGQNWAWFGLALLSGRAANITQPAVETIPADAALTQPSQSPALQIGDGTITSRTSPRIIDRAPLRTRNGESYRNSAQADVTFFDNGTCYVEVHELDGTGIPVWRSGPDINDETNTEEAAFYLQQLEALERCLTGVRIFYHTVK